MKFIWPGVLALNHVIHLALQKTVNRLPHFITTIWLGPAPWRQYNEKRSHYNWHWFWDTGNGDTGNQGPHQFDFARWGLNKNEHPVSVYAAGGVYGIDPKECAQETPNTLSCTFKYSDGKMLEFETRGRYTNGETDVDITIGNMFYGTEGYLELKGESGRPWKAFRKREKEPFAGSKEESLQIIRIPFPEAEAKITFPTLSMQYVQGKTKI